MRDPSLKTLTLEAVTGSAEGWVNIEAAAPFTARIIEKILSNSRIRDRKLLSRWQNLLTAALCEQKDHWTRRSILSQHSAVLKRLGKQEEARQCRVRIGEEWETEANERKSESSLVAATLFQDAFEAYAKAGESKKAEEMKLRIRESYKQAEQTEFGVISQEFQIDFSEWDARVAQWLALAPGESLMCLAADFSLMPTWEQAAQLAGELPTISVDTHDHAARRQASGAPPNR